MEHALNESLVDSHLKCIPGLRTFTAGRLSCCDFKSLGRKTNGSLDAEILRLGAFDQLLAHLLKRSDLAAGESDTDLVSFLSL
jgi:hypothetical protein